MAVHLSQCSVAGEIQLGQLIGVAGQIGQCSVFGEIQCSELIGVAGEIQQRGVLGEIQFRQLIVVKGQGRQCGIGRNIQRGQLIAAAEQTLQFGASGDIQPGQVVESALQCFQLSQGRDVQRSAETFVVEIQFLYSFFCNISTPGDKVPAGGIVSGIRSGERSLGGNDGVDGCNVIVAVSVSIAVRRKSCRGDHGEHQSDAQEDGENSFFEHSFTSYIKVGISNIYRYIYIYHFGNFVNRNDKI